MSKLIGEKSYSSQTINLVRNARNNDSKFSIKDEIDLILFTSHTPCKFILI